MRLTDRVEPRQKNGPAHDSISAWPRFPTIYEINTWVWLTELSNKYGAPIELGSIPEAEWDAIGGFGFDAVWLMGVWERSPVGLSIANRNAGLVEDFRRCLPDYHPLDNVGSPYCIRRYVVDELLGGPAGLAATREQLARRGMRLILDFVPNHVAPDHPWVESNPELLIQGSAADIRDDPASYLEQKERVFACGRDPYFPAWPDVLQLNAFAPELRQAAVETLASIAEQADGTRCDMAMLLLNTVFERTWGPRAGRRPESEYWSEVISAVRKSSPGFLFIAEVYWGLEWELQQLGFDYCYDKTLYDRLEHETAESIRLHLCAEPAFAERLVRFLENHDEPRAAAVFPNARERAAAVVMATLPGARLFHEGQFEGRKVRVPVFLGRRPVEAIDREMLAFYTRLLQAVNRPAFREGQWSLCDRTGWPDNSTYLNLVAWNWACPEARYLIVVNLSDGPSQGRIRMRGSDLHGGKLRLVDGLSGAAFERSGDELQGEGIYVDLGAWQYHFFRCDLIGQPAMLVAA